MTLTVVPTLVYEDSPRTRRTDPDTSHAAADSNNIHASQVAVLRVLAVCVDGLADFEISDLVEMWPVIYSEGVRYTGSRLRTARNEAAENGHVELIVGKTRKTHAGSKARVWKITDAGLAYLREVSP